MFVRVTSAWRRPAQAGAFRSNLPAGPLAYTRHSGLSFSSSSKNEPESQVGRIRTMVTPEERECLEALEQKIIWLSSYMIHHANNLREKTDGMKVGGHQASSSSVATILAALYFKHMGAQDRVAVKPHASPIYHSIQYLFGNQSKENMANFRSFGGVQSYPSITKDAVDVDFSTGSVGLGASVTSFASYIQDYLLEKKLTPKLLGPSGEPGRMFALVGDAELDEGNMFESLMESQKLKVRNNVWIVDYNRQSLDNTVQNQHFRSVEKMFRSVGWNVITIKYGSRLRAAFESEGGRALKAWLNNCSNDNYSVLSFQGGKAFRDRITAEAGNEPGMAALLSRYNDDELYRTLTDLGGHDFDAILSALADADASSNPTCIIAYTVKGHRLPLAGHRDNHGLFMNTPQMDAFRAANGIAEGQEWDKFAGLAIDPARLQQFLEDVPYMRTKKRTFSSPPLPVVSAGVEFKEFGESLSTQAAFGQILLDMAKSKAEFADRIVTTAPDVATTTNLSAFVNKRGVFGRNKEKDVMKANKLFSVSKYDKSPMGQYIQLGIAESNLMLLLAAAGLSDRLFGQRLLPVGTLYDPFVARALDALNYGCYMDSRFMLVGTPSGISLAPEGGAHQSIGTPLIGIGQPNLAYFEPSYADELKEVMLWGFEHMQAPEGSSVYLRLSTRTVGQVSREMTPELRSQILAGGYWASEGPTDSTRVVIAYTGVVAPEAVAACNELNRAQPGSASLLQVTSPDLLYHGWQDESRTGQRSHARELLAPLESRRDVGIVSVVDGHAAALGWLGAVHGHRMTTLGVASFGQSGNVAQLYEYYRIDTPSIVSVAKQYMN